MLKIENHRIIQYSMITHGKNLSLVTVLGILPEHHGSLKKYVYYTDLTRINAPRGQRHHLVYYCASRMKNDVWHITGAENQLPDV